MKPIIHHVCIQTNTYEESLDFYRELLGFQLLKETVGFHGRGYNSWLERENFMIELQTGKGTELLSPASEKTEGLVHFCMYTENLVEAYEELKKKGFQNFKTKNGADIYEVEGGKLLKLFAPEGTVIELRDSWTL